MRVLMGGVQLGNPRKRARRTVIRGPLNKKQRNKGQLLPLQINAGGLVHMPSLYRKGHLYSRILALTMKIHRILTEHLLGINRHWEHIADPLNRKPSSQLSICKAFLWAPNLNGTRNIQWDSEDVLVWEQVIFSVKPHSSWFDPDRVQVLYLIFIGV